MSSGSGDLILLCTCERVATTAAKDFVPCHDCNHPSFKAFYAGMDALVDWVREDPLSNDWDPGYLDTATAWRMYKQWIQTP